jgi:hypothetical protein
MKGVLSEYEFSELTRLLFLLALLSGVFGLAAGIGIGLAIANTGVLDQFLPRLSRAEFIIVIVANLFIISIILVAERGDAITILRQIVVEHYLDEDVE